MKHRITTLIFAAAIAVVVSGCATQIGRADGSAVNPFCTLVGAAAGGGGAAALTAGLGPIGAGIFVGALLGSLACSSDPVPAQPLAEVVPQPPMPAPPPPPPPEPDSDGDGVIDRLDRCPNTPLGTKVDVNGCPDVLLTLTGINFKFDSSAIEPGSETILNQAVETLNQMSGVEVRIEGHTDSVGTDAYNLKLSDRRASAVRDYLIQHGIAAARLSTEGKGESQPIAPNTTADGRYQNRRVEFHTAGPYASSSTSTDSWSRLNRLARLTDL